MTVVCIAGMHRSGTSMVARILNLSGLYLGEPQELIPATPDNPEGHWENDKFVQINNEILARQDGGWDKPPRMTRGWERRRDISALTPRTRDLIGSFSDHKNWGWKDPRNSLTLPYWAKFLPGMKTIVCLRNPLEVANSLAKRGSASSIFSFRLWQTYNERLMMAVKAGTCLITHYNSYFLDARTEIVRLLKFVGLPVDEMALTAACAAAATDLRHSRSTLEDLMGANAPVEVLELYTEMCAEAGPVFWGSYYDTLKTALSAKRAVAHAPESAVGLALRLAEKDQTLRAVEAQFGRIKAERESTFVSRLGRFWTSLWRRGVS